MQNELPGKGKEAEKKAEAGASEAGAKLDQYAKDAKGEVEKAASKTEKELKGAVDSFDKNVQDVSTLCNVFAVINICLAMD